LNIVTGSHRQGMPDGGGRRGPRQPPLDGAWATPGRGKPAKLGGSGSGGGGGGSAAAGEPVVLPGPKTPLWSCGRCGTDGNWASRLQCRGCRNPAPQSTIVKARAAASAARADTAARKPAAGGKDKGEAGMLREELRKARDENRKLQQRVAKLAGEEEGSGKDIGKDKVEADEADGALLSQLREDIAALEKMAGAEALLASKRKQLDDALVAKRAAKPVDGQIRDVEFALDRRRKARQKKEAVAKDLRDQAKALEAKAQEAEAEQAVIEKDIAELEIKRNELYRRKVPGSMQSSAAASSSPAAAEAAKESLAKLVAALGPQATCLDEAAKAALSALEQAVKKLEAEEPKKDKDDGGDDFEGSDVDMGEGAKQALTPQAAGAAAAGAVQCTWTAKEFEEFVVRMGFNGTLAEAKALLNGPKRKQPRIA